MWLNVYVNNNFVKREEVGTPNGGCFYIEGWGQIVEIFIGGGGGFYFEVLNVRNSMYWRGGAVSLGLGGCGMGGVR